MPPAQQALAADMIKDLSTPFEYQAYIKFMTITKKRLIHAGACDQNLMQTQVFTSYNPFTTNRSTVFHYQTWKVQFKPLCKKIVGCAKFNICTNFDINTIHCNYFVQNSLQEYKTKEPKWKNCH